MICWSVAERVLAVADQRENEKPRLGSFLSEIKKSINQKLRCESKKYTAGVGALVLGTARNPSLRDELFRIAILGFALTEAIALFALMMAFLILFAL